MSLTDHNSVRGVRSALEAARLCGINLISGIEIDCVFQDINLHVLGYSIDIEDRAFIEIEEAAKDQERSVFTKLIIRLQHMGFKIQSDDVRKASPMSIPSPEFIGEFLLSRSENESDSRLDPYRPGGVRFDMPYFNFYRDFCTRDKPAYIESVIPSCQPLLMSFKNQEVFPFLPIREDH